MVGKYANTRPPVLTVSIYYSYTRTVCTNEALEAREALRNGEQLNLRWLARVMENAQLFFTRGSVTNI